jgi:hypothetical protein
MTGVYNYDLVKEDGTSLLQDYWDVLLNPDGGEIWSGSPQGAFQRLRTPFSIIDFLKPSAESAKYLRESKTAMVGGLTSAKDAILLFENRVPADGFFLSPAMLQQMTGAPTPADITNLMDFSRKIVEESIASIEDPAHTAIFPVLRGGPSACGYYVQNDFQNWPTTIDGANAIGANFSVLFTYPLTSVFELAASGEPVFYRLDGTAFTPITLFDDIQPAMDRFLFIRMPDATLKGFLPSANLPADDPATRIMIRWVDWNDRTFPISDPRCGNGKWDPGEVIFGFSIDWNFESGVFSGPIIDVSRLGDHGGLTPEQFYGGPVTREQAFAMIDANGYDALSPLTDAANLQALRDALYALSQTQMSTPGYSPTLFVYREGVSLFFKIPEMYAWNSVTRPGTVATYQSVTYTSMGSMWWALLFPTYQ